MTLTNHKEATGSSLDIITFAIWAFPALQVEQSPMEPPQQHKNSESSRKTAPNTCHPPTQQRLGSKALIVRFLQYHVSYFCVHSQDSKTLKIHPMRCFLEGQVLGINLSHADALPSTPVLYEASPACCT